MNLIFGPRKIEQRKLQRSLALFLIFLMVFDLGLHLVDPYSRSSEDSAGILLRTRGTDPEPFGGCGIPGHDGTPFHHHHFLALVSQTASSVPMLELEWISGILSCEIVPFSLVTPIGRAPPIQF